MRHRVENLLARLKDWGRIATGYDRCAPIFLSAVLLCPPGRHPHLLVMRPEPRACGQMILPSRLCCVATFGKGGCHGRPTLCAHGSALVAHRTTASRSGYGPWRYRKRQPSVSRSCSLETPHGCSLAASTRFFGNGNSRFRRFRRWATSGVLQRLFETLSGDPDSEYVPIDGAIVPVHQQAAGAKGALSASAWTALRRADSEDGGPGGRPGPSGALPPATRTEPREQRGSTAAQQPPRWCSAG